MERSCFHVVTHTTDVKTGAQRGLNVLTNLTPLLPDDHYEFINVLNITNMLIVLGVLGAQKCNTLSGPRNKTPNAVCEDKV